MQSSYESPDTPFVSGQMGRSGKKAKKKLWIGVGIVAVVVAGIVLTAIVLNKPSSHQAAQPVAAISSTVASVSIDPTGYTPKTIKVKKGQEITWTNKDTVSHHLTADQTELPSFDTAEMLDPGDSYTYIFDKSGTFHYYDPADPQNYVGTVTVE